MGKYNLVGSYYDKYSREHKYKSEEIIKIPNQDLTTLESIDYVTAGYSSFTTFSASLVPSYQDKNIFSIRGMTSKGEYFYKSVIYDNKPLQEVIESIKSKTIYTINGYRSIKRITANTAFFTSNFDEFKTLVTNKNEEALKTIFGEKSDFSFFLHQYLSSAKEEDAIIEEDRALEENFRNYEVFRRFLTNKGKIHCQNLKVRESVSKLNNYKNVSTPNIVIPFVTSTTDSSLDEYDPDEYAFYDEKEMEMMAGGEGNFYGRRR